jgi:two-component system sensor histidine kinase PhoQ
MERGIEVEQLLPQDLSVRGDERDLMEMLGNLLENAFKYTTRRIAIRGERAENTVVTIEDDGPGIAAQLRREVLNRGTRADRLQPGQGIGLAMVQELLEAYEGELEIAESRWGGALIKLTLP